MGDYRATEWGSQRSTPAHNPCHSSLLLAPFAQLADSRGTQTISRQQHHLSNRAISCIISAHAPFGNSLIPSRHQFQTQHVLDTFPLTNHSPLTVGSSSSGRCLKIHNPTCEVRLGPFAARPFSIGCLERSVL